MSVRDSINSPAGFSRLDAVAGLAIVAVALALSIRAIANSRTISEKRITMDRERNIAAMTNGIKWRKGEFRWGAKPAALPLGIALDDEGIPRQEAPSLAAEPQPSDFKQSNHAASVEPRAP